MRFFAMSLAIAGVLAVTACAGKSSSNSDQSNGANMNASSGAATTAPAATAEGAGANIPTYPGATTAYSATNQGSSGTVLTTDDSFDKVYAWYQQNLPAGSEKSHMTAPVQSAVFSIGPPNDVTGISITASNGKTTITIGHQKT